MGKGGSLNWKSEGMGILTLQLEVRRQGEGLCVEFPQFYRLNHDQFANKEHELATMDTRQALINQA